MITTEISNEVVQPFQRSSLITKTCKATMRRCQSLIASALTVISYTLFAGSFIVIANQGASGEPEQTDSEATQ